MSQLRFQQSADSFPLHRTKAKKVDLVGIENFIGVLSLKNSLEDILASGQHLADRSGIIEDDELLPSLCNLCRTFSILSSQRGPVLDTASTRCSKTRPRSWVRSCLLPKSRLLHRGSVGAAQLRSVVDEARGLPRSSLLLRRS